jgi:Na+/melibiose symporter-like transporter
MLMMSFIPSIGAVVAVAALWFYELDEPMVKKMTADLGARRASELPALSA